MKRIFTLAFFVLAFSFSYAQTLTEVYLPQYIQGLSGTNSNRVPYVFRVTLSGLSASATYRYYNQVVISTDAATTAGAGNVIYASGAGTFTRTSSPGLSTAGSYGTFTTDANGSYTGWFLNEPSGNARFAVGNSVFFRIILNDGNNGTAVITRLTTTNSATVINFGTSATTGSGLRITANASFNASNFVMLYDNSTGTGRPITGSFVENDGSDNSTANSYVAFYANNVNGVAQTWGTIIPNALPNGILKIQEYSLINGNPTVVISSADGTYPGTNGNPVDTKNPSSGTTALAINGSSVILPLQLTRFSANKQGVFSGLTWEVAQENNIAHYTIERSVDGRKFSTVGNVASLGNTATARSYSFTDANPLKATNYYRLKITEKDGKVSYSEVRLLNFGSQINIAVYPNPAKDKITLTGVEAGMSIRLLDAVGKVLQIQKATSTTENLLLSGLSKSVYSLQIYSAGGSLLSSSLLVKE